MHSDENNPVIRDEVIEGTIAANTEPKTYDMAIILEVTAPTYDAAEEIASNIADGLSDSEQMPAAAMLQWSNECETDNDGQRVIYLHPAGTDNSWELED